MADRLLIVGAGPTGLAAAISAKRHGLDPIIVDRNDGPKRQSRAVGVNYASLGLLGPCGAAAELIAHGTRVMHVRLFDDARPVARLDVPQPPDGVPAMVALPQSETEAILVKTLAGLGVTVRWGHAAEAIEHDDAGVRLTLASGERLAGEWLLGADGSRSMVRHSLGLTLSGRTYDGTWSLADVVVDWPFPDDQAAGFLSGDGSVLFVITIGKGRFRAISNQPDAVARVRAHMTVRHVELEDTFHVPLRRVDRFGAGRVWLAGDAAHVHSPVGGMGMNLGFEDAMDFVATLSAAPAGAAPDFAGYDARRLRAAKRVLAVSDRAYRVVTLKGSLGRWVRNRTIQTVTGVGFLRRGLINLTMRTGRHTP